MIDVKQPLASNHILRQMGRNEIPSTIPKKGIKFLRDSLPPRRNLKSLRNSMRLSKTCGLVDHCIFGIWFMNLVLGASNHMMGV